jgi:hypothetical protein
MTNGNHEWTNISLYLKKKNADQWNMIKEELDISDNLLFENFMDAFHFLVTDNSLVPTKSTKLSEAQWLKYRKIARQKNAQGTAKLFIDGTPSKAI